MKQNKAKIKYIIAVTIYGTIGIILREISFPSELVVFCRGFIGTLFILAYLKITNKEINKAAIKENLKYLIISGAFLGFNWVFLFAAYNHTTVAIASLCNYLAPIILVYLAPILYKETLTPKKAFCIICAFIGIVLVSGVIDNKGGFNLFGIILGLLAALCFVGLVIFNKKLKGIGPYEKTIIQLSTSALVVLPYLILNNLGNTIIFNTKSLLLTIVLGIVHTGIAYIFYFGSLSDIEVGAVAILGYIEPVVSILGSVLILAEPLSLLGLIGAVLILGSAIISEL